MNYGLGDILKYGLLYLEGVSGIAPLVLWMGAVCVASYLIGSLNSGIIISKLKYKDDIRNHGSGNAGMTNMLRTFGKKAALLTIVGDMSKTIICCILGSLVAGQSGAFIAGFASMIGHMWPVWFKFKGGKGIMSLAALTLFCEPAMCLVLFTVFFIITASTKYLSLGSVISVMLYPIVLTRFIGTQNFVVIPAFIMCMVIVWQHRSNIKRLYNKNENKTHFGKNGGFLPKWVLIVISAVLVLGSFTAIYFKFIKKTYAVEYETFKMTPVHLRVLFIDEKNAYFGDGEKNDEHDEEIMERALEKAKRIVVIGQTATDAGYSISEKGSASVRARFDSELADQPGYVEGDTAETYCHRVYGGDVSPAMVKDVYIELEFIKEYAQAAGEEAVQKILSEKEAKIDKKSVSSIIGGY